MSIDHPTVPSSREEAAITAAVFVRAPFPIWVVGADGRILLQNDAAEACIRPSLGPVDARVRRAPGGQVGDAVVATRVWDLPCWVAPNAALLLEAAVAEAMQGRPVSFETDLSAPDAGVRTVDAIVSPVTDGAGGRTVVRIDAIDVTERVRTDAALRASEAKFSGILSIAADAIITTDEHGVIVHFNRGAETIFGYTAAEMIGRSIAQLLPERFRDAHRSQMLRFGRGPDSARRMGERSEIFGLRKNGKEFPAEASISKLDAPDRRLLTVVLRDVSDRRRVEAGRRFLAESGAVLASSLDEATTLRALATLPVPILADAVLVDVVTPGDTIRRTASGHGDPTVARHLRLLESRYAPTWSARTPVVGVLRTGQSLFLPALDAAAAAAEFTRDDEHQRIIASLNLRSLMLLPLVAHDTVVGVMTFGAFGDREFTPDDLALAREYTVRGAFAIENARLYAASHRATRARDEVLKVVSHDLRNPLSAIRMCVGVLRASNAPPPPQRDEILANIENATDMAHRLIEDLLAIAHLEAGHLPLQRTLVSASALLAAARPMLESLAAHRPVTLDIPASDALPAVLADTQRIGQVFANLVGNAAKFTPVGGRVAIRVTRDGDMLRFSVADTGPGIPHEQQGMIFERGWHHRRGAEVPGTGLGLTISQGIVHAHGGTIWVESEPPHGATFHFTIPIASAE